MRDRLPLLCFIRVNFKASCGTGIGILHAQDANTLDFLSASGTRLRRSPPLIPQK